MSVLGPVKKKQYTVLQERERERYWPVPAIQSDLWIQLLEKCLLRGNRIWNIPQFGTVESIGRNIETSDRKYLSSRERD